MPLFQTITKKLTHWKRLQTHVKQAVAQEEARHEKFGKYMEAAKKLARCDKEQLQTLINFIARGVQAELFDWAFSGKEGFGDPESLLFPSYATITDDGRSANEFLIRAIREDDPFALSEYIVLPWPWNDKRLTDCFMYIGTKNNPWRFDPINHNIALYKPFNVGFVGGGNHSLATGIVKGCGIVERYELVDMRGIYEFLYCDGLHYRAKESNAIIHNVPIMELGAIFEIGRLMLE